jgi:glycosyltransferase involved in cell wall biosynthesis
LTDVAVSICIRGSRGATLPDAVESVLAQGRSDIEVIVGDEHGTLRGVVERFADPRLLYRPFAATPGPSAHARTLMNEASGRYLVLMDDDDWWLPGFLAATTARLDADPALGVAFSSFFHSAGGVLCARDWTLPAGRHDEFLPTFLRGAPIGLSFAVMRREVWEESERAQPLRDDAAVDAMVWIRAAQAGWPFYFLPERLGVYRMHAGQMSNRMEFVRDRAVRLWETFRFDDPEAELFRRRRLREALLERANLRLRQGRVGAAYEDIRGARAVFPKSYGVRDVLALLGIRRGPTRLMARHAWVARSAFALWPVVTHFDRWTEPQ